MGGLGIVRDAVLLRKRLVQLAPQPQLARQNGAVVNCVQKTSSRKFLTKRSSEPQPVKMISSGFAPISCATAALALFTAAAHDRPKACPLDGLPQWSCRNGMAASATSGHTGLVAW